MVLVFDPRGAGISGDMVLAALVDMGADGEGICGLSQGVRRADTRLVHQGDVVPEGEPRGCPGAPAWYWRRDDQTSLPAGEVADAIPGRRIQDGTLRGGRRIRQPQYKIPDIRRSPHPRRVPRLGPPARGRVSGYTCRHRRNRGRPGSAGRGGRERDHHAGKRGRRVRHILPRNVPEPGPPAVLEILREAGIPVEGGPAGTETATPTGACILAGLQAAPRPFYPQIRASAVGYGSGSREISGAANVLRIVRGEGEHARLRQDQRAGDQRR